MKYCIIGSGAFGINLSYNLLKKGHEVTLITNKLESVSSIYARGISLKLPSTQWLRNVYFKMNNYNYIWTFLWSIITYANSFYYLKYKKIAIYNSKKIINSYKLNYDICGKKYFINLPFIFNKMIEDMKKNPKFKLILNTLNDKAIQELSEKEDFDLVFDCRGSNVFKHNFCENIGGYKITIEADTNKKCFSLEDGWFVHTDINNKKHFIVKGGMIIGSKVYDTLDLSESEKLKIKNIIMNKPFWKKYNCKKIIEIRKGTRQYSIDMIPFYTKNNKLVTIHGGSAVGAVLSPYVTNSIINDVIYNKKIKPYDFSESRPQTHYNDAIKYICYFIICIILIKRTYKFGFKRHLGIKL